MMRMRSTLAFVRIVIIYDNRIVVLDFMLPMCKFHVILLKELMNKQLYGFQQYQRRL
jgi:hypothetical protein